MMLGTGVIGGPKDATISYVDNAMSASNSVSSYNFGTRNIGTAHPSRVLVAVVSWSPMTSGTFGNFQIGGNNASHFSGPGSLSFGSTILFTLPYPTGTTANVTATIASGSFFLCYWAMWALYDLKTSTPSAWAFDNGTSNPRTSTIDVPAGGVLLGYAGRLNNVAAGFTWSGLTEDFDVAGGISSSGKQSGASGAFPAAQTGYSVTTNGGGTHGQLLAAFR